MLDIDVLLSNDSSREKEKNVTPVFLIFSLLFLYSIVGSIRGVRLIGKDLFSVPLSF